MGPISKMYKVDASGNLQWSMVSTLFSIIDHVEYSSTGLFVSTEEGFGTGRIVKLSLTGDIIWERVMDDAGGPNWWIMHDFVVDQTGNPVVIGINWGTDSLFNDNYSLAAVKLDGSNGNNLWHKIFGTPDYQTGFGGSIQNTPDGGFIIGTGGQTNASPSSEVLYVFRTNALGETSTNQIIGRAFIENNTDCEPQPAETGLANRTIKATSGTKIWTTKTNAAGEFDLRVGPGNHAVSIENAGIYWNFCNNPASATLAGSYDTATVNFGATAIALCPDLHLSIAAPFFRRCFNTNYLTVFYENLGTATAQSASIVVRLDSLLEFISTTGQLLSLVGQELTFSLGDVAAGASGTFKIRVKPDCDTPLGEQLCVEGHIFPDTSCIGSTVAAEWAENRICLPVIASYDPNDKTAFIHGRPENASIRPDSSLEYLIRFQNTGTDTAFTVVVRDTLSALLDAFSVQAGAASHPFEFDLLEGRILKFTFRDILLPDSNINEPASHGFVKFFVKQKPGNPIGPTIENRAAIFFDFNAPVLTNTVSLVLSPASKTGEPAVLPQAKIWPQPARDEVRVDIQSVENQSFIVKIFDLTGRLVRSEQAAGPSFLLKRNGLPAGVFFLQLLGEKGATASARLVFE